MARFDWFAWHRNYRTDEWIHSLSEAERWAWVAFLSYANETDFVVQKCNPDLLSPLLTVTSVTLRNMLSSAIKNGKIIEEGGEWFVKRGDKYRVGVDKTAPARMAKMREKQKLEKESVTDVTRNNRNTTKSDVTCQDNDTNKDKNKTNTEDKPRSGSGAAEPPVSEELFQNPVNELVTQILKKQKSRTEKIGPMRHLFGKIYGWCGITEPNPEVHDKALFVLFGAIQENGMERLIDDFRDRNYNPNKDPQARFEAYIAAGWSERNKTKPKPNGKVVQWSGPE